jgi:hypothetical protein
VLPTLWQQFGEGLSLFQHDNAPRHKARSIQKWFVDIVVEEIDLPAQSPDLNPIEHLWDELQRRLPDLTNAVVAEWKQVHTAVAASSGNPVWLLGGIYSISMTTISERDV